MSDRVHVTIDKPVMRSAAHHSHVSLRAAFDSRGAWEVPASYGSELVEVEALTTGIGLADVSARAKLHLSGAIESLVSQLTGGQLDVGAIYSSTSGGRVARLSRDWALVLGAPSTETVVLTALIQDPDGADMATDVTSAMSGFVVAGPRTEELFARSVRLDFSQIEPGHCVATQWARIPAVLCVLENARPMVEMYVGSEHGRYAWSTLVELGERLGGIPVGWKALEASGWM
jgi:glycine cleavage system aminomethyltransferase T